MSLPPRHIRRYPASSSGSSSSTAGPGSLDEGEEEDVFLKYLPHHHQTLPQRQTAHRLVLCACAIGACVYFCSARAELWGALNPVTRIARVTSRNGMSYHKNRTCIMCSQVAAANAHTNRHNNYVGASWTITNTLRVMIILGNKTNFFFKAESGCVLHNSFITE